MKKIKMAIVAAMFCACGYCGYTSYISSSSSNLLATNIESLTACESVGWWENDGNCVSNGSDYFCKSDSWYEFDTCIN